MSHSTTIVTKDLFEREQWVLTQARERLADMRNGGCCDPMEFSAMVSEYAQMLRLVRRLTRISDKTTVNLNTRKINLQNRVNTDELTGLYNNRFAWEQLDRIIGAMSRSGFGGLGILMIDIDFFKQYNDAYGHLGGDAALRKVASTLGSCINRDEDFVARYGGEEFIAVLPNADEEGTRVVARRMLDAVWAQAMPHRASQAADRITISIGATSGGISVSRKAIDYVKYADSALYRSKNDGRNRYTYFGMDNGGAEEEE